MNLDRIEAILRLLQRQEQIGELSAEGDGWRLRVKKGAVVPPILLQETAAAEEAAPEVFQHIVRAGRVGIFRCPHGTLRPGDSVNRGATVGHIDSMRILNPVVAEETGYVAEVLVEDGDPVEYGQGLFVLGPEPVAAE